jgi:hypothetical protein
VNEPRDIPGVIAPPLICGLGVRSGALDWLLPSFILQNAFGFWTRLIIGATLGVTLID